MDSMLKGTRHFINSNCVKTMDCSVWPCCTCEFVKMGDSCHMLIEERFPGSLQIRVIMSFLYVGGGGVM